MRRHSLSLLSISNLRLARGSLSLSQRRPAARPTAPTQPSSVRRLSIAIAMVVLMHQVGRRHLMIRAKPARRYSRPAMAVLFRLTFARRTRELVPAQLNRGVLFK